MTVKVHEHSIEFSSGRRIHATDGFIGLTPEFVVGEGRDSETWSRHDKRPYLTRDDLIELAAHMIKRWTAFGTSIL